MERQSLPKRADFVVSHCQSGAKAFLIDNDTTAQYGMGGK